MFNEILIDEMRNKRKKNVMITNLILSIKYSFLQYIQYNDEP